MVQEKKPELINPEEIESVILVTDDQCTPCQLIQEHLRKLEKEGGYPGTIQIIDPTSDEAERFFNGDQIGVPSAVIRKKDGTEKACDIFMNEETLALQCEGKLLILNDVPQEIREQVKEMTQPAAGLPTPAVPGDLPTPP